MWAIINQLQLLTLLVITEAYLPKDIRDYINGMEFSMFSFSFIPFINIPLLHDYVEWLDFQQPDVRMQTVEVNSGSALINNLSFLVLLVPMLLLHVVIALLYC